MNTLTTRPTRIRWLVLALLFLISVVTYIDRVNISVTAREMMPAYGMSDQQMGWVFSAFVVGYALFQIPGGWLADRWGVRVVLALALLWWSICTGFTAIAAMSPLVSLLKEGGHIEARAVHQRSAFEVGVQFARAEGILPAPEPTHAIRAAVDEALAAREAGEARVILFNLCGHGHFDLTAYERYLDGTLEDYEYPREKVEAALAGLPAVG